MLLIGSILKDQMKKWARDRTERWSFLHIEHAYYFFLHRNDARRMLCASFETEISLWVWVCAGYSWLNCVAAIKFELSHRPFLHLLCLDERKTKRQQPNVLFHLDDSICFFFSLSYSSLHRAYDMHTHITLDFFLQSAAISVDIFSF